MIKILYANGRQHQKFWSDLIEVMFTLLQSCKSFTSYNSNFNNTYKINCFTSSNIIYLFYHVIGHKSTQI